MDFCKVTEQYRQLPRLWDNYKHLLEESVNSFKRLKVSRAKEIVCISLSSIQETFKVQLQKEQEKAINEIVLLRSSFKATGPHRADMPIAAALRECQEIEEQIEAIELEEQRLKAAYRIFHLDMAMSQDLPHIKKVHVGVRVDRADSFV